VFWYFDWRHDIIKFKLLILFSFTIVSDISLYDFITFFNSNHSTLFYAWYVFYCLSIIYLFNSNYINTILKSSVMIKPIWSLTSSNSFLGKSFHSFVLYSPSPKSSFLMYGQLKLRQESLSSLG
jgi:hypothetical protein